MNRPHTTTPKCYSCNMHGILRGIFFSMIMILAWQVRAIAQTEVEPLYDAIRADDFHGTQALLFSGSNPNQRFRNGRFPLQVARSCKMLALLLDASGGFTPEVPGAALIERYARISAERSISTNQRDEYLRMVRFLVDRGQTMSPVAAAYLEKIDVVRKRILDDAEWIHSDESLNTAIAFIETENLDGLRLLLVAGLNPNSTAYTHGNLTLPLLQYCVDKPDALARLLCAAGAEVNKKIHITGGTSGPPFGNEFTSLHTAAKIGSSKVCQVLVNFGSDVDAIDSLGRTPLFYAMSFSKQAKLSENFGQNKERLHDYVEIVQLLLKNDASIDKEDTNGESPLSLAVSPGLPESIRELVIAKHSPGKGGPP